VPVGKVRFYDAEKGFGFLTKDEGGDVYVRANALPPGVTSLKPGQKVEFGIVEGRRGEQALSLHLLEAPPSLAKAARKPADQMAVIVEDLIKMLDGVGNNYRRGRYPDSRTGSKVASVLRAVADELEL
jgi:cold shock protein